MHMPKTRANSEENWGSPYVRSWHGEGTRLVIWHMWPMMMVGWMVFMVGAMMGAKVAMKKQYMMRGGPMGPMGGHGAWHHGMKHHHHGYGTPACLCIECDQVEQAAEEGRPEGGG